MQTFAGRKTDIKQTVYDLSLILEVLQYAVEVKDSVLFLCNVSIISALFFILIDLVNTVSVAALASITQSFRQNFSSALIHSCLNIFLLEIRFWMAPKPKQETKTPCLIFTLLTISGVTFFDCYFDCWEKHKLTPKKCSCAIEHTKETMYLMWIHIELWNFH